nr:MarR family winged helix-turn-helix transcriptional regulator [Jiangella muralis]
MFVIIGDDAPAFLSAQHFISYHDMLAPACHYGGEDSGLILVMTTKGGHVESAPLTKDDYEALARFRFGIRQYLRFSEVTVRSHGLTPQQYQLLLALKGFPGREWATIAELAERLQLRHHSVVELVNRARDQGLVQRAVHPADARAVRVQLTPDGQGALARLGALHRDELRRMGGALALPSWAEAPDMGRGET